MVGDGDVQGPVLATGGGVDYGYVAGFGADVDIIHSTGVVGCLGPTTAGSA